MCFDFVIGSSHHCPAVPAEVRVDSYVEPPLRKMQSPGTASLRVGAVPTAKFYRGEGS